MGAGRTDKLRRQVGSAVKRLSSELKSRWTALDLEIGLRFAIAIQRATLVRARIPAVRMLQDVGIPEALRSIERFGFPSMPSVPSLALGSGEVTLLSLTSAFASFGNAGRRVPPTVIRRVETIDGELLYVHEPTPVPV